MQEEQKETQVVLDDNLAAKLREIDDFPVDWASRDKYGNLQLTGNVFRVRAAPSPMFGQNIRDFGFARALDMAEQCDEYADDHDFGSCYIRDRSLRKESDGRWYVDLAVDPHKCRYHNVATMLVDEHNNPIMGDDGKPQIKIAPRKESHITVALDMIEPNLSHPLSAPYVQRDRRTVAAIRTATRSAKIAEGGGKQKKEGSGRGHRRRLTPDQIAAALAKANNA